MGKTLPQFAEEMSVLMPRLLKVFIKEQAHAIMKEKVSMPQIAILVILREKGECMMSEIAKALSVTTSAVTGMVDRMVQSGMLERVRDTKDRRVINIQITPKGERTINTIFKNRQKMMVEIFSNLSSREREFYLNIVKKIYSILIRGQK